ncbi:hypothetical protein HCN44_001133 [Aphidius gifuensis]|uniref:F-actin monooxygenase n=1 Tax=Aphidius gifuensis TaxID=684658 RepID=A0A834XKG0_APHGI|nr:hypothetical protein HCN44_001133 [Aphidius gifuensis]
MMHDHGHHAARKQTPLSPEVALANDVFDQFCNASTLKSILGHFRHLCELLNMRPNTFPQFYPKFKSKLRSWKAQALWKKFDLKANHKCYNRGKASSNTRVLIIGGGPCGLRSAIEAQLLGAKVVVIEKRDRMSRNNVLHLWPFVIQDLRSLGAKKFFGKFCAGSIDHISIRQLQCILLKVSLILGVEFYEGVSFDSLIPPPSPTTTSSSSSSSKNANDNGDDNDNDNDDDDNIDEDVKIGWHANTTPSDHPVSQYEFDVLIGADGKRNTLDGFKRKEFRGKLAIAITANFINKRTEAEARVEEISGVAFIFNQKFFKELYQDTGIDLENIVYYKDDTHYFVMTAKKHSLIDKGVILHDHPDTAKLLAKDNVNRDALMLYAREAADFSTQYQMMNMEFAVNHYGQPDVAMFDFTSMYAAENASRVIEKNGFKLLQILVGDSLLEPFWPTGSGCARGFLSSMDAGWSIKSWSNTLTTPLDVIAERESIYRLLGQTTPENLNRDYAAYTLDPHTRYPNLNVRSVSTIQVMGLWDTDDPDKIKQPFPLPLNYNNNNNIELPKKRRKRDIQIHPDTLLNWLQRQVVLYDNVQITDMTNSFKDGLAICAIIHRYRPDLIDFYSLKSDETEKNNQLAYDVLEKELGISPIMTGEEMVNCDVPDKLDMFSYLTQVYEVFKGEIPFVKYPKLEPETDERPLYDKQLAQLTKCGLIGRITKHDGTTRTRHSRSSRHNNENLQTIDKKIDASLGRRSRKRRSTEKMGASVEERQKRLEDIVNNRIERMKRRQFLRKMATQQFYKSIQMLQVNAKNDKDEPFEDYSIFLYRQTAADFKDRVKELEQKILYPDRDPKMLLHQKGGADEDFSGRIKNFEDKLRGNSSIDKKPRDLLRAIGKIEKSDWNVKEIEKKIEESKMNCGSKQDRERVPKWSREQFLARQIKMEKKGNDTTTNDDKKYAEIDNTLKFIDKKIKEGNILGHNKVSAMAEQFTNKQNDNNEQQLKIQRSNSKAAIVLPTQGGSETCHFCDKRVYLMERLSAEGKYFHRGCFRCEYCSTSLRIGNHTFDRDKNGGRFYCTQHFGLTGTIKTRIDKKKIPLINKENIIDTPNKLQINTEKNLLKPPIDGVVGLDLLDRGQTPERIEFKNRAGMSDAEEAHSQMDEDEWTDRNFGASAAEMGSSDDISDMSDSDEENEIYEEAIDQPLTTEGTIELAKNWTLRYSTNPQGSENNSDTGSNEYEDSSDEYTSEGLVARRRKKEVWLKVPPRESDDTETGSETEVASDETTSEECLENSATEISTDSEFEHDGTTPTQPDIPEITINDAFIRKTRGQYVEPKKVQIKSRMISPVNGNLRPIIDEPSKKTSQILSKNKEASLLSNKNNQSSSKDLIKNDLTTRPTTLFNPSPLINPRKGDYLLNRTHSTGGIASKSSLELKKKFLLGPSSIGGSVIKSGSTSNVDTKLRNFTDAISQHQKLLNPAPEPSPTMQAFLQGTNKLHNTPNIPLSPILKNLSTTTTSTLNDNKKNEIFNFNKIHLPDLIKETNIIDSNKITNNYHKKNHDNDDDDIDEITKIENLKIIDDLISNIDDKCEDRPRSPVEETPIIVSQVNWTNDVNKNDKIDNDDSSDDLEIDSDSLSSSETDDNDDKITRKNIDLPKLKIHNTDGNLLHDDNIEPDSIECFAMNNLAKNNKTADDEEDENDIIKTPVNEIKNIWHKSTNEIEILNNNIKTLDIHNAQPCLSTCSSPTTSLTSNVSCKNDESIDNDLTTTTTAALTETELSEWAIDGEIILQNDIHDTDYNINNKKINYKNAQIAKEEDLTDIDTLSDNKIYNNSNNNKTVQLPNNDTSKLLVNDEDIDYMDTDNESLLDSLKDTQNIPIIKNRGYIEFVNVPGISTNYINNNINSNNNSNNNTNAPIAQSEIVNDFIIYNDDNYNNKYDNNVIEINPVTLDDVKERLNVKKNIDTTHCKDDEINETSINDVGQSMDEDSLLMIEQPEDTTTTSELTTIKANPIICTLPINDTNDINNPDYIEYVKRLQSRIAEFSNVKDSIDIRKSKRKNSKVLVQQQQQEQEQRSSNDIIIEENKTNDNTNNINNNNKNYNSPATSRKLEELTRERSKQKNLIQDLLMDKIEAHKQKSAEKKAKRAARNASFNNGLKTSGSLTFVPGNLGVQCSTPIRTTFAEAKKTLDFTKNNNDDDDNNDDVFKTPIAPPRLKHEEARKTAEKAKQEARERARLKSDEDLGLSPEDKIKLLKMKFSKRQLSMEERKKFIDNDYNDNINNNESTRHYSLTINKNIGKLQSSKSTDNVKILNKKINNNDDNLNNNLPSLAKSLDVLIDNNNDDDDKKILLKIDNIDDNVVVKRDKKKIKDPERRKSIIQAVSDFFKKKDTTPSPTGIKDKNSMFRITGRKDKLKLFRSYSEEYVIDKMESKSDIRPKSISEGMLIENFLRHESLPSVPPPPINYSFNETQISDDSLSDDNSKTTTAAVPSPSKINKNTTIDESCSSITRKLKNQKKLNRQAQLKRLRIAQEIQRKLEETEVKQRDLEYRGVSVEKALRGEGEYTGKNENQLFGEWFDLMKERTDLRRLEKELLVRAQEVQLEDRHERLEHELRERLADDDTKKTSEDVKKEGEILTEMLEIVAKRDSLIALLEEERKRYKDEDKDLEAQMKAKGLKSTHVEKNDTKYTV